MKRSDSIAIQLTNVSKRYTIHHEKPTLVERLMEKNPPAGGEEFWALKDISLTIRKGESVGIIGPNGSGKTTLLKIIAGITAPTTGSVETQGRIVSLIDLEAGFHPDLSGYQNIFLNGMLLGIKKGEIEDKLDAIIRFADIGSFIDTPLFTYSAGMKLRLGFAIAMHAEPDIFLIDESLAVGDGDFRLKCMRALDSVESTVLFASHDLRFVYRLAQRTLILDGGQTQTHRFDRQIRRIHSLPENAEFTVTVASESMTDTIKRGTRLLLRKTPFGLVQRGDIIAFCFPHLSLPMVHRVADTIQGKGKTTLITKGDANIGYDAWRVEKSHYLGTLS